MKIEKCFKPRTSFGGGLILKTTVSRRGGVNRSWVFRYTWNGDRLEMGLGTYPEVKETAAKNVAADMAKLVREGKNPKTVREETKAAAIVAEASAATFTDFAEEWFKGHADSIKPRSRPLWTRMIRHCDPYFGKVDVKAVTTVMISNALEPIWKEIAPTAAKYRGCIEMIFESVRAKGLRSDNPTPLKKGMHKQNHELAPYSSLHENDIPDFMSALRGLDGMPARALEFLILTGVRTIDVRTARWEDMDLETAVWSGGKTVGKKTRHDGPLVGRALEILKSLGPKREGLVFESLWRPGKRISNSTFLDLLKKRLGKWKGRDGRQLTAHGFRSTFVTWVDDARKGLADIQIGHAEKGTLRHYRYALNPEQRRPLMLDWDTYCTTPKVVPFRRAQSAASPST